jgi:hypothetical protein
MVHACRHRRFRLESCTILRCLQLHARNYRQSDRCRYVLIYQPLKFKIESDTDYGYKQEHILSATISVDCIRNTLTSSVQQ